ncbi:MAG: 16S rRNA (uracil(1498)-N(3))-methyltransferase [Clostridiales bacterium]
MSTYFIKENNVLNNEIIIDGDLCHHLGSVLRCKINDELDFSDNAEKIYHGQISAISKKEIRLNILEIKDIENEPPINVYLIQCLPRGDKMEQIIQKCVELGIYGILPVESENSQVRLKGKIEEKTKRYQKIAAAAAEQCGRGKIPLVKVLENPEKALDFLPEDTHILFCYEKEGNHGLKSELLKVTTKNIAILIGPEGGFSDQEAKLIVRKGGVSVTMGPRILRTETAGLSCLVGIMYELGDWGRIVEN